MASENKLNGKTEDALDSGHLDSLIKGAIKKDYETSEVSPELQKIWDMIAKQRGESDTEKSPKGIREDKEI